MNLPRGGVRHARFEEGSDEVLVTFYMTEDRSRDAVTRVGVPLSVVNGLYGLPLSVRIFRQCCFICTSRPARYCTACTPPRLFYTTTYARSAVC